MPITLPSPEALQGSTELSVHFLYFTDGKTEAWGSELAIQGHTAKKEQS